MSEHAPAADYEYMLARMREVQISLIVSGGRTAVYEELLYQVFLGAGMTAIEPEDFIDTPTAA